MVPMALTAVVITVVSFAVGFGWVAGGDDAATVVVGGLVEPSEEPGPAEQPAGQSSREFSEVPAETVPILPIAEPTLGEPEILESSVRPTPVAATEATVDAAPIELTVPAPAPPGTDGLLLLRSTPPGVRVMVNGEARGTTPLALSDFSYGAYDVRFFLEGYESQQRRLVISSDEPIAAISAKLARVTETSTTSRSVGSIFVDTRPRGVEVWLDQQLVGKSPMLIPDVSAGAHEVEFRYVGYRTWVTIVQVDPFAQARVTASLDHVLQ